MIEVNDLKIINETAYEFISKITSVLGNVNSEISKTEEDNINPLEKDAVLIKVQVEDPQILIGQGGQTLFETQRILRMILNKKLSKVFYVDLDINNYKEKKAGYIRDLAKDLADQVSISKEEKALQPMPAYERRILHKELAKRADVVSESRGEGLSRHIIIKPR